GPPRAPQCPARTTHDRPGPSTQAVAPRPCQVPSHSATRPGSGANTQRAIRRAGRGNAPYDQGPHLISRGMMAGFLLRRALNYVVLLLLASFLTFSLASLTFRPLDSLEQRNPRPPQSVIDAKAEQLHLDEPIPQRYVIWMKGVVQGDFGETLGGQPVSEEL